MAFKQTSTSYTPCYTYTLETYEYAVSDTLVEVYWKLTVSGTGNFSGYPWKGTTPKLYIYCKDLEGKEFNINNEYILDGSDDSVVGTYSGLSGESATFQSAFMYLFAYDPSVRNGGAYQIKFSIGAEPASESQVDYDTAMCVYAPFTEYSYYIDPVTGNKVWIKDAGTWKEAKLFVNQSGTWKEGAPKVNQNGNW